MAFLTPEEINTHLFDDVLEAIDDETNTKLKTAISAAQEDALGYLTDYDTTAIFSATGDNRNPIILLYCKDIAVWHFIALANPNCDYEARQRRYEFAIAELGKIQSGKKNPQLPRRADPTPPAQQGQVRYGNSRRRNQGFL